MIGLTSPCSELEEVTEAAYPTNKTKTEIEDTNKKNKEKYDKQMDEYVSRRSKVKPEPYEKLNYLTADFVEKNDLKMFDEKRNYNNILRLLYFKRIFNRVKDLDNEYKKIIDEKLTTNQMLSDNTDNTDNTDNERTSSIFSIF